MSRGFAFLVTIIVCWHGVATALSLTDVAIFSL